MTSNSQKEQNPPLIVSCEWLNSHLEDGDVKIFDCTSVMGTPANTGFEQYYKAAHIPGAAHLDLASENSLFCNRQIPRPLAWPTEEQLEYAIGRAGVNQNTHVILYAQTDTALPPSAIFWATRAWFFMYQAGISCSVLDGGWQKWRSENLPVSTDITKNKSTLFESKSFKGELIVGKETVIDLQKNKKAALIDSLSVESFSGELTRPYAARNGHITRAVNVPYDRVLKAGSATFLSSSELQNLFLGLNEKTTKNPIFYCGGGVAATLPAFAYKLAGLGEPRIYASGLAEWANCPELPMSTTL